MLQRLERINIHEIGYFSTVFVEKETASTFAHFRKVLKVIARFLEHRTRSCRTVHVADISFPHHRVEYRGGSSIADAQVSLE